MMRARARERRQRRPRLRRSLARTTQSISKTVAILAFILFGATFVFWQADIWVLRDKLEHLRGALFGSYVSPKCRIDPDRCDDDRKKPNAARASKQDPCRNRPGLKLHCQFQTLYAYFNTQLFENRLPPAVITLQRKSGVAGYFAYRRFKSREGRTIDELALNPSTFGRASMLQLAATLVHEMVHLEQAHFGRPGQSGFHNAEWGEMMRRVGLHPSTTGKPGGAETGTKMTHYIAEGGLFDVAARAHPLVQVSKVALTE